MKRQKKMKLFEVCLSIQQSKNTKMFNLLSHETKKKQQIFKTEKPKRPIVLLID